MVMTHDAQSLSAIAANSAAASRVCVHEMLGRSDVQVSCVCLSFIKFCVHLCDVFVSCSLLARLARGARYDGPVERCVRVTQKTQLQFTWHLVAKDFHEACEVRLLCHDAARRGVHLPKAWKSKRNVGAAVLAVDDIARLAVRRVREELSLPDELKIDCRLPLVSTHAYIPERVSFVFTMNRYVGDVSATLTWRCNLCFHWAVAVVGAIHESDVHVRADHAGERGVPLPEGWQILSRLDVFAHMAVQRAREELSLSDAAKLDCRLALLSFAHTYTVVHRSRIDTKKKHNWYAVDSGSLLHRSRIDTKKRQQVCRGQRLIADMAQQPCLPLEI